MAHAADPAADGTPRQEVLRQRLAEQTERLDALKRSLAVQEAALEQLRRAVHDDALAAERGKGQESTPAPVAAPPAATAQSSTAPARPPAATTKPPVNSAQSNATQNNAAQKNSSAQKSGNAQSNTAAEQTAQATGVLTPPGKYVLEPSLQYSYSSSNRVALIGYTIVPALLIGLIDVREVKRNTVTASLGGRFGVTNRFEVEARIPYVYRSDSTVSREVATGSATDRVFEASGRALGDVELGMRYQLNDGGVNKPYYIGTLRFKTRTGRDPFEVVTDCSQRCVGNTTGTGLPLELPTGSGFYSLQTGVTWLFPSDPAVFFGSATYLHNFKRENVSRRVLSGQSEPLGTIEPGGIFGFNFGIGLALNDRATFSIGYDHNTVGKTKQRGQVVPGSVRTQLGTLLLGYSYRVNEKRTVSLSVGAGLTRDTPDLTIGLKMPIAY